MASERLPALLGLPEKDAFAHDCLERAASASLSGQERLEALGALLRERRAERAGGTAVPPASREVNNHVHTIYSFSPYTPSMAAYRARAAGLAAAGSVDHDSIAAAEEMLGASALLGIGATVGFEIRVSFRDSPFADRKINNPDSTGIVYMTVQGLPRAAFGAARDFLKPIARARGERNRRMTKAIAARLEEAGYRSIDYDRDVLPLSKATEGGSVTERHILAAAATSMIERHGKGSALVEGIGRCLGLVCPPRVAAWLSDSDNAHYLFDLLGLLKTGFLESVFEQPGAAECVPASEAVAFALRAGAIPAYAYLGDIADSPTGDKKAEKFEDEFLDELIPYLADLGYRAIAYMPPRNSAAQLARLRGLCSRAGLMEISGVDINSSRQSFNCAEVLDPAMTHLVDATWALIAHERLSGIDPRFGLFAADNPLASMPIAGRIESYGTFGRSLKSTDPDDRATLSRFARELEKHHGNA
ncbi:MAG: PHP domain-containing protein [Treponema sp.]|nr:PHP domain-containing protein [Treponema sp.]